MEKARKAADHQKPTSNSVHVDHRGATNNDDAGPFGLNILRSINHHTYPQLFCAISLEIVVWMKPVS